MGLMFIGKLQTMSALTDMDRLLSRIKNRVLKTRFNGGTRAAPVRVGSQSKLKDSDYRTAFRRRSKTAGDALGISMSRLLSCVWRKHNSLVHEIRQEE